MEKFIGLRYKMVKKENFNDLMSFLGKNYIERKLAETLTPVQVLSKNDDGTYVIHYYSALVNHHTVFVPGVEFDETKPDRTQFRCLITIEGNKIIQKDTDKRGRTMMHVFDFSQDNLIITTTANEIKRPVIRYYDRVQ